MQIWEQHQYLYHYTDKAGLLGILNTQTLWATHYTGMNDSSELEHFFPIFEEKIFQIVNLIMRKEARGSLKFKRFLDKSGGLHRTSRLEAKNIAKIFYDITFRGRQDRGPFAAPYLTSFCAHTHHSEYVQRNGLLSQWRGYGDDGGFAIVFDSKLLAQLFTSELEQYDYAAFEFGDVIYDDQIDERFESENPDLMPRIAEFIEARVEEQPGNPSSIFEPLFLAASRLKHQGFKEESEVRLMVSPIPAHVFELAITQGSPIEKEQKPVQCREKRGQQISYIQLNDVKRQRPLPINRIIVGPQKDQKKQVELLEKTLHRSIVKRLSVSDTPFIP